MDAQVIPLRRNKADDVLARVTAARPTSVMVAYVRPDGEVVIDGALRSGDDGFGIVGGLDVLHGWLVDALLER